MLTLQQQSLVAFKVAEEAQKMEKNAELKLQDAKASLEGFKKIVNAAYEEAHRLTYGPYGIADGFVSENDKKQYDQAIENWREANKMMAPRMKDITLCEEQLATKAMACKAAWDAYYQIEKLIWEKSIEVPKRPWASWFAPSVRKKTGTHETAHYYLSLHM
jgi:hypothetical protein